MRRDLQWAIGWLIDGLLVVWAALVLASFVYGGWSLAHHLH